MLENGKKYFFFSDDAELEKYDGTEAEVIRPLTDKECDIADVGPMYRIRFFDGCERDAFEDELFADMKCSSLSKTNAGRRYLYGDRCRTCQYFRAKCPHM